MNPVKSGRGPRFLLLLGGAVLVLTTQVVGEGRWVFFTPCGFAEIPGFIPEDSLEALTQPAPGYVSYAVDRTAVAAVIEYRRLEGSTGPKCSDVVLSEGNSRLVVGGMSDILKKLGDTMLSEEFIEGWQAARAYWSANHGSIPPYPPQPASDLAPEKEETPIGTDKEE